MTAIEAALKDAMGRRGLTVADLARELDVPEPTLRAIVDGRTAKPHRVVRDALDAYFAPACPGTTLRICRGELFSYPGMERARLCRLVTLIPDDMVEHVTAVLGSWLDG